MSMDSIKKKVEDIVQDYISNNQEEYEAVCKQLENQRENLKTRFATVSSNGLDNHALQRKLYEVPLTLDSLFTKKLNRDELTQMSDKVFAKWFMNKYPEFKITA